MSNKQSQTAKVAQDEAAGSETILLTASGAHALDLELADSFASRFRGLMLAAPLQENQGLLLTHCPSVHCAFLRYAIDVIYLDKTGKVLKCVPRLKPWRCSVSNAGKDREGRPYPRAAHTLELAAGSIERLDIRPGDRLAHPYWRALQPPALSLISGAARAERQRGSALVEFVVVGPILIVLGLAVLQYGMLFFAKNQINHGSFMAARAGSTGNANLGLIQEAYVAALMPLYGGGTNDAALSAALTKAANDIGANTHIDILNPTKESFDDWNDPALQKALGIGKRVIPNGNLAFKPQTVGSASGQTIQDANLIKLRITHGYQPKVPVVSSLYNVYLKWLDTKTDAFHTKLVDAGRIPLVTSVTLQMHSDVIEPDNPVSAPGPGNNGTPANPGEPPVVSTKPPDCKTMSCESKPVKPVDPGGPCIGADCPICPSA